MMFTIICIDFNTCIDVYCMHVFLLNCVRLIAFTMSIA